MKTFKTWLLTFSAERLVTDYGVDRNKAFNLLNDLHAYGLNALDVHLTPEQQVELCRSYAWVYRPIEQAETKEEEVEYCGACLKALRPAIKFN